MRAVLIIFIYICTASAQQVVDNKILENFIRTEIGYSEKLEDHKCGTIYDLMIHAPQNRVDPGLRQNYLLKAMKSPGRDKSQLSASGYFMLHWDENGSHAVPIEDLSGNGLPDYIDSAAVIFEKVRDIAVNQMGYQPPYSSDGNPTIPYHIYFTNMSYYGITRPDYVDIPSLPGINYPSYIEVENDYKGFPTPGLNGLRVTAAHEFHHAIQLGYNVRWDDSYFYEMTSTWMEEVIYPEINDYLNYLNDFFNSLSNTQFNQYSGFYPYANSLYLQMLQANYGIDIVKIIWDHMNSESPIPAINSALNTLNTTWLSSLGEYGLWLYYTGDRTMPDQFFSDAEYFPQVRIRAIDQYEFEEEFSENIVTVLTANRYIMFSGLDFNRYNFRVETYTDPQGGFRYVTSTNFSPFYPLNSPITNQQINAGTMVVILTNAGDENLDNSLTITAGEDLDLSTIYAYPNPVNLQKAELIKFQNVPPEADLYIFNTLGERVAVVEGAGGSTIRSWSMSNTMGKKVVSGVYMYLVQGEGTTKTGKFSVIR